ncbi:hypothetical protein ACAG25_05545 [Mycobacterium sp. pV006]|uniref:hypothetical protein n=1 Tax=Mycobacterium sp. pV006 TaxID=3238983 RepID=UPI00351AFCD5
MAEIALRALAAAGVLSIGVLAAAPPVLAQPSDTDGSTQTNDAPDDGASDTGDTSIGDAGDPPKTTAPEPEITVDDEDDEPLVSGGSGTRDAPPPDAIAPPPPAKKAEFENSLKVPFFRLPAADEIPAGTWPSISSFYTTVDIPLPTLGEFFAALRLVPNPTPPPPGPRMGIMQEEPVLDAGTGIPGGAVAGADGTTAGSGSTVFRAPLVVSVPRAMTSAGPGAPRARTVGPGRAGDQPTTAPGVAGVRTPPIRGSIAPTPGTAVPAAPTAASGQLARPAGYPRVLTGPTLAEIAAVALPGLAGLMLVTFGGGVIGYRQANSLRFVRTAGAERFLP